MDEKSFIPYYYQIKQDISVQIRNGTLKENQKIQSENELAKKYNVSRPTVRKALDELVFAGLLVRKQGKGTLIAAKKINKNLLYFSFLSEDLEAIKKSPSEKTISKSVVEAPLTIIRHGIDPTHAVRTIQVVLARKYQAKYLKVKIGFPLILWEGVTYSEKNIPFELTRALYRSDKFQFQFEQHRDNVIKKVSEVSMP
jgi:DNA-binding GntR family transcriptional regulator